MQDGGVDNFHRRVWTPANMVRADPIRGEPVPATSPASRARRAVDVRLLIGIALVVGSVAGVVGIVSASDRRVAVYAAASTLAPGDRIEPADLVVRQVALDDAESLYLTPGDVPSGGLVVASVVRTGELVPRASLGSSDGRHSTTLVLQLSGRVSAAVVAGALVDVWSAPAATADVSSLGSFGPPTVLTADAVVVRVVDDEGIVASSDGDAVEVLVPRTRIARILQAIANGDALAVVPAGIPLGDE